MLCLFELYMILALAKSSKLDKFVMSIIFANVILYFGRAKFKG